jgi:hypothetical protein
MKVFWLVFPLAVVFLVSIHVKADSRKQIVGATEVVLIADVNLSFKARVDTGAKTSSVHAEDIKIGFSGDPQGKPISFYLVTKDGLSKKVETRVSSVVKVRTSEMSEHRYVVPLQIIWKGTKKSILVTLNDRTTMEFRLLLGRNWLHGDFIVDVDKNNVD